MKLNEAKLDPTVEVRSTKKTVEVTATAKSAHKTGSKRLVPAHMVDHLLKKGMIENPNAKSK